MAAEMNIREADYYKMTPMEFERLYRGFRLRDEREWDRARTIIAAVMNSNSRRQFKPDEIIHLPLIDAHAKLAKDEEEKYHQLEQDRLRKFVKKIKGHG